MRNLCVRIWIQVLAVLLALAEVPQALGQHQHEGDVIVGVNLTGKLTVEADLDEALEVLPISPGIPGVYEGWAGHAPGFEALEADEPDEEFYMLGTGAEIHLVGLSPFDAALKVRDHDDFSVVIDASGGSWLLGDETLHTHPIWHVDSLTPGFDVGVAPFSGTFKLMDLGTTGYAESDPFVLSFTPVPEPASAVFLGASLLILSRRRFRRQ